MSLIRPGYVQRGDYIGIAATARKISANELQKALPYIESRGYHILLASNIFSEYHQFAGTDEERAKGLQELLDHPNIKAIFIARGGYGTIRILDKLCFQQFLKFPKWICGFSDITALHSHLFNIHVQSVHSTMPLLFHQSDVATQSLFDCIEGKKIHYPISPHPLNKPGKTEGILIGGNLSVLYAISGSVSQPFYKDKILFIEEVDEYLYHIDRMMMHLKRAGILKQLNGLIVGGMSAMKDHPIPFGNTAEEIIYEAVKDYDYPVCFGFPAGHIADNYAFIHGQKIQLSVLTNIVSVAM